MQPPRSTNLAESGSSSVIGPGPRPLSDVTEAEASTAWAILDASPDAVVMVDGHGLIELANRQTELLFGYDRGELLGRPVEVLLPERISRAHTAHRTCFGATPEMRSMGSGAGLFARRADGSEIAVEVNLSPVDLHGELHVIAAVRDVSERIAAEAFDLEIQQALAAAQRKASVLEDRARIGRDMHDTVIARLLATGMSIAASIGRLDDPALRQRFSALADEIDTSINEIRTTIYGIRSQTDWGEGLRGQILAVVVDRSRLIGFEPTVKLHGAIDELPVRIGDELLATIQEALGNIAKHAQANAVIVSVEVTTAHLDVHIEDDGVGFSAAVGAESHTTLTGHGVANMTARAESLNGTATISSAADHGTTVSWTVPLP